MASEIFFWFVQQTSNLCMSIWIRLLFSHHKNNEEISYYNETNCFFVTSGSGSESGLLSLSLSVCTVGQWVSSHEASTVMSSFSCHKLMCCFPCLLHKLVWALIRFRISVVLESAWLHWMQTQAVKFPLWLKTFLNNTKLLRNVLITWKTKLFWDTEM